VIATQDAQRRPRRLEAQRLAEASAWLERYRDALEINFTRLDQLLTEIDEAPRPAKSARQRSRVSKRTSKE
jgi:hypothetical protein